MKKTFKTEGICSTEINLEIVDGKIKDVEFVRGCSGNLKAISILVKGMNAEEAMEKLKDIECGTKGTSCAAQLSKAIGESIQQ